MCSVAALFDLSMSSDDGCVVFTFAGGAWYHAFYFGVGAALAKLSKDRADPAVRFCGVSSGSLVAASLAYELDMEECFETALSAFPAAARNPFKVVGCTVDGIRKSLPPDEVLLKVSQQKRLLIGISRQSSMFQLMPENVTQFRDRDHALAVQSASVHVPLLGGVRGVLVDGERYFDGQLTQNWSCLPLFNDLCDERDCVIRITAYHSGEFSKLQSGWITPQVELPGNWQLFPHSVDALRLLWRLGYLRATEYLSHSWGAPLLESKFKEIDDETRAKTQDDLQQVVFQINQMANEAGMWR